MLSFITKYKKQIYLKLNIKNNKPYNQYHTNKKFELYAFKILY